MVRVKFALVAIQSAISSFSTSESEFSGDWLRLRQDGCVVGTRSFLFRGMAWDAFPVSLDGGLGGSATEAGSRSSLCTELDATDLAIKSGAGPEGPAPGD